MFIYDVFTLLLIATGHLYLFLLFLNMSKISLRFTVLLSILFTLFLCISIMLTQFIEFNIILLTGFLLLLGTIQKKHSAVHTLYYTLLSMVLFTVLKNGLYFIIYTLYMASPFNYYVWTPSVINFYTVLFLVVSIFCLRKFIKLIGNYLVHSKLYWPSYILLLLCIFALLVINYPTLQFLSTLNARFGEQLYMSVLLITILLLLVITIRTYRSKEQLIQQHEQTKQAQLLEYVEKLEFMHDELATFRHDYLNLLLSLEQAIRTNDLQQVKQIYEQTIAPTAAIMNHQQLELTKLARIDSPELKSLISVKVLTAQRRELNIQLDIPETVSSIAMPMDQFIRIISVLLDNAIEEAGKSTDKLVQIAIFTYNASLHIIVRNSIASTNINLEKLYEKSYSTKGDAHGYGLFSVQRIVQKHPHVTLATSTDQDQALFSQQLQIKDLAHRS